MAIAVRFGSKTKLCKLTIFERLFDRVVVISLPISVDRREYVRRHFQDISIGQYEFHDAYGSDHPAVQTLYADGRVAQYPPCFRCGRTECGKSDCNNVLIPQQVAVFATYINLWRRLAKINERVLVCEDDIVFHHWTRKVLAELADRIEAGEISFSREEAALLRLGWGLGQDHNGAIPFHTNHEVRMSNPCHAITSAYARKLLEEFDGVHNTVDVFQHRLSKASKDHALTIFPPIASDLSWSVGSMASLIHPKENHARHLESLGLPDEADQYRKKISTHFMGVAHRKPS